MSQPRRHWQRKQPRKTRGFSWARMPSDGLGVIEYRLFRYDLANVPHIERRAFRFDTSRKDMAAALAYMRNRLRDKVDAIILHQLGVTDEPLTA